MNKDKFEQLADILHTEGLVGLNEHYAKQITVLKIIAYVLLFISFAYVIRCTSFQVAYNETKRNEIYLKAENDCLKKEIVKANEYIQSVQPKGYKLNN